MYSVWRKCQTIPTDVSTSNVWEFWSFHMVTNISCFLIFDYSHHSMCEMISCAFDLPFSNDYWCQASFHVLVGHLCIFFGVMSIEVFWPLLIGLFVFLFLSFRRSLYVLEWNLYEIYDCKYFLPFTSLIMSFDAQFLLIYFCEVQFIFFLFFSLLFSNLRIYFQSQGQEDLPLYSFLSVL